ELVALAIVKLLDRADEPERALLDQVEERKAAAEIRLRDRDDESQVRLDHVLLRGHVATLDPLRERDLLVRSEQRHLSDLTEVEAQGVERGLDAEIELGCPLLLLGRCSRLLVREGLVLLALHELDRMVDQV